jgi:hypothetical protein
MWGKPAIILEKFSSYDGDAEYESIVAGLRQQLEGN